LAENRGKALPVHFYCHYIGRQFPMGDTMMTLKRAQAFSCAAVACVSLALGALWAPAAMAQAAPPAAAAPAPNAQDYRIGVGDSLQIFVWRNPELTTSVPVRPDGKISIPLVEDVMATGSTPSELARTLESRLARYITNPNVTVLVNSFAGSYEQQVRIVGEAAQPKAILYKNNMTVLDAMIEVGGLTRFASGNRATLVRKVNGQQTEIRLRLDDLIKDGNVSANVALRPGDIIIIPQSYF
jgi:polysaccharide export outer membrane protein